jgi:hypothetical protein
VFWGGRELARGGAVWQLVGLITRRSKVQILPPQPQRVWWVWDKKVREIICSAMRMNRHGNDFFRKKLEGSIEKKLLKESGLESG